MPKYKSHRVFAIDGSIINLPSLLKNQGFHQAPGNHYPQGLVSILFNVLNRTICGLNFSSNHCERKAASELSASLEPGDILLGDKGYLSFGFLCELSERGLSAVFAVQQGQTFKEIVAFRESNLTEDTVTIDPSKQTYQNARARHPGVDLLPQKLRLIKFHIGSSIEVLATTIFDENFTASEIADLYWLRWRIEELYKVFKCILNIENFHSKSANGVEQELHAASILWNYSRFLESYIPEKPFKVVTRSKTSPYQVNFTQTLAAVRENLNMLLFGWGRKLHEAIERCIRRIVRTLLPVRPGRQNERKSKKPPNKWFTSKKERQRNSGDRKVSA